MAEARHTGGTFGVNSPAREALAKLLIEKGVITQREFLQKIAEEGNLSKTAETDSAMRRNKSVAGSYFLR
jgi:hypothetical protein